MIHGSIAALTRSMSSSLPHSERTRVVVNLGDIRASRFT